MQTQTSLLSTYDHSQTAHWGSQQHHAEQARLQALCCFLHPCAACPSPANREGQRYSSSEVLNIWVSRETNGSLTPMMNNHSALGQ